MFSVTAYTAAKKYKRQLISFASIEKEQDPERSEPDTGCQRPSGQERILSGCGSGLESNIG